MISIDIEKLAEALAERLRLEERSPWMTTTQAAEHCAVSERTFRSWLTAGDLPFRRVDGGRLIFNRRELDAWIDQQRP